jgi:hypothetical protein
MFGLEEGAMVSAANSLECGGQAAIFRHRWMTLNPQLGPRLKLMQKILDLWPEN